MFSFGYNSSTYVADSSSSSSAARGGGGGALIANLGYATNNRYPQFPPIMADGRSVVSSWNPESQWNQQIAATQNLDSNWKYRHFLINNADTILENQYFASSNDTGSFLPNTYKAESMQENSARGGDKDDAMMSIPFFYTSYSSNPSYPKGYVPREPSDLKSMYLNREQLFARKFTPSMQKK